MIPSKYITLELLKTEKFLILLKIASLLSLHFGQGQLIPGFEKAVTGLNVGDSTTVDIPSKEAYGDVRDDPDYFCTKRPASR